MSFWESIVFICPTLFIAGIIDGIAGGGRTDRIGRLMS